MPSDLVDRANRPCENCGSEEDVRWESSRTAYDTTPRNAWQLLEQLDPDWESPNRDVALCRECAEDHHSYWTAMWDEYNADRY